jgi:hypothetical protein
LLPLAIGVVPGGYQEQFVNNLLNDIVTVHSTHLTTGILGTKYVRRSADAETEKQNTQIRAQRAIQMSNFHAIAERLGRYLPLVLSDLNRTDLALQLVRPSTATMHHSAPLFTVIRLW